LILTFIQELSQWEIPSSYVSKSKMAEGYEFVGNYMAIFFGVPGFKYEAKPLLDVAEALKMIGMG
jgi:hypothetical protein